MAMSGSTGAFKQLCKQPRPEPLNTIPNIWSPIGSPERTNLRYYMIICGGSMPTGLSMWSVATADESLNFLLKYRKDLFPHTPIVFSVAQRPTADATCSWGLASLGSFSPKLT